MLKKLLICLLCVTSAAIVTAGPIKEEPLTHRFFMKNGLNKKVMIGKHSIVLTRIDDKMIRIHFNAKPRYRSLKVEAYDRFGKKMKLLKKGENLSTASISKHKYMYKTLPMYIDIK